MSDQLYPNQLPRYRKSRAGHVLQVPSASSKPLVDVLMHKLSRRSIDRVARAFRRSRAHVRRLAPAADRWHATFTMPFPLQGLLDKHLAGSIAAQRELQERSVRCASR